MLKVYSKRALSEGFNLIEENDDKFNIYQSLFKRFIYCIDSVQLLTEDLKSNPHRIHSLAINLRAGLLDYLIVLYLSTLQVEKKFGYPLSDLSYREELDKLISEQIRRILTVSERDKKTEFYDHEKFCSMVDLIHEKFKFLFDSNVPIDYNKPAKSLRHSANDDISIRRILLRLDDYPKDLMKIDYSTVVHLYNYYSKYDHFGVASMALEYNDLNKDCELLFLSLIHVTDGISVCINLLKDEANSDSDFSKFLKEIDNIRSYIHTKTLELSDKYKNNHN